MTTDLCLENELKNYLKSYNDDELLSNTQKLVVEERKHTLSILHHFREIEKRRLFALRGFSSLFEMAVQSFGYSEAAASRRIAAARLLSEVPEVEKKVEEGKLSVTTLSTLQYFFNDQKRQRKPLTIEHKREVIEQVEHKSKRETEKVLAVISGEPIRRDQVRVLDSTHSEIRFTADEALQKNLARIRALKGHKDLKDYNALFLYMSELVLEKVDPERRIQKKEARSESLNANTAGGAAVQKSESTAEQRNIAYKNIASKQKISAQAIKDAVWKRDHGACTYIDPLTNRRCASRHALEYDHVIPKALGGPYTVENLRLRCRAHNALYAIQTYGIKKMQGYLSL